jgi:basic membrane protein A
MLAAALIFAGCGEAPTPPPAEPNVAVTLPGEVPGNETAEEGFVPCVIATLSGFDDNSFNQAAYTGLTDATEQLGITNFPSIVAMAETDFVSGLETLIGQDCTLIVATGFQMNDPVVNTALAHPDVHFLLVDSDGYVDGNPPPANVKSALFDTAQGAFLAGYVSAAYSSREGGANHVGTFGGLPIPSVTVFMDGFRQGVEYFNEQNGTNVQVTGMDSFTGGFSANQQAQTLAQGIIAQGVDVILPVGGPIYQSAVAAIHDAGRPVALIGVDQDLFFSDPTTQDIVLTSILKHVDAAVRNAVLDSAHGAWDPSPFVGTLANGSVGIAPFHNFESEIPADVQARVQQLQTDIIEGRVPVESYLANN